MLTEQQTIAILQKHETESPTLAYHAFQTGVSRLPLGKNSTLATIRDSAIGDPISQSSDFDQLVETSVKEFKTKSFFHISETFAAKLKRMNFNVHQLGIETLITLPFSLAGHAKADLRRARNRALGAGVSVVEVSPAEYQEWAHSIAQLNRSWLESRSVFKREFRYLARPHTERYKPGERRFLALANSQVVGLAVYDPFHKNGKTTGYFEAIARSFDTSLPGVRDLLTLTAMKRFAADGAKILSLGLSPFVFTNSDQSASTSDYALRLFSRFGERVFNCRGLAFHKSRFRGTEVPVYYATRSRFPLLALYQMCRLSNIDPLQALHNYPARILKSLSAVLDAKIGVSSDPALSGKLPQPSPSTS